MSTIAPPGTGPTPAGGGSRRAAAGEYWRLVVPKMPTGVGSWPLFGATIV
jgi:hypothetical protein